MTHLHWRRLRWALPAAALVFLLLFLVACKPVGNRGRIPAVPGTARTSIPPLASCATGRHLNHVDCDGLFRIGVDIQPGLYRFTAPAAPGAGATDTRSFCYWAVYQYVADAAAAYNAPGDPYRVGQIVDIPLRAQYGAVEITYCGRGTRIGDA